jgi:superfamily II DNA or RNA helicase
MPFVGFLPSLRLFTEKLLVNHGTGFAPDFVEVALPVVRLNFSYAGVEVRSSHPNDRVFVSEGSAVQSLARDYEAEKKARYVLESFGAVELGCLEDYEAPYDSEADYLIRADGDVHSFCSFSAYAVPQLRKQGWQVDVAEDYTYRVVEGDAPWYASVTPEEEKPDWFGLELGVQINGQRINLLPVLIGLLEGSTEGCTLRDLARTQNRFMALPIGDGRYLPVPPERLRVLLKILNELYEGGGQTPTLRFHEHQAGALEELGDAIGGDGIAIDWGDEDDDSSPRASVQRSRNQPIAPPPAELRATLRPYQLEGLAFLQSLREHNASGILADDMGLGKTLQTIAHIVVEKAAGRLTRPVLIVTPTSLTGNWVRELERFAPHLSVVVVYGSRRQQRWSDVSGTDVAITTYPVLSRDIESAQAREYHLLILDEAQNIKNSRSLAHLACRSVEARHRLCLSGTPVENNLGELWSLFQFLMPGFLGDQQGFRMRFRAPIEQGGDEERLDALRGRVAPFILRRTKEQVAKELPPKTEIVRPVELAGAQRELYESIRVAAHAEVRRAIKKKGLAASAITILDALMKLRQVCCDPRLVSFQAAREVTESAKYEHLMELVRAQLAQQRRILIFSQFTSMLALISQGFAAEGIRHTSLTGSTDNRQKPIDAFERGDADVFLISLKAGGVGLNLTSADTVIHYDPWWNPAAQAQATDRAYRIGQKRPVFVYNLIVAGSVEERMLRLQQRKRKLAETLLDAKPAEKAELSLTDVEGLLAPLSEMKTGATPVPPKTAPKPST